MIKNREQQFRTKYKGIYIVVNPSGAKRYKLRIRDSRGFNKTFTFHTIKEAKDTQAIIRGQKVSDYVNLSQGQYRFSREIAEWNAKIEENRAVSYHKDCSSIINNHLIPFFKDKSLNKFTIEDIEDYKKFRLNQPTFHRNRKKLKLTSAGRINKELAILLVFFKDMVRWRKIKYNPIWGFDKLEDVPISENGIEIAQDLTLEQIKKFFIFLPEDKVAIFKLAIYTGMRKNECLLLKKSMVDLPNRTITVVIGSRTTHKTKSKRLRYVYISEKLVPYLKKAMDNSTDWVFPNKRGKPYLDLRKTMWTALKRAGVSNFKRFRFHWFRHLFSSYFSRAGNTTRHLQQSIGWSDIKLAERYAHLNRSDLQQSINKLDFE